MANSVRENPRDALVRCAAELFRTKGYERTTVRDLARAVGMQSGSLFYHFKSKEEILYAVVQEGIERPQQRTAELLKSAETIEDKLQALFRGHLQALLGDAQDAMAVMLYDWRSLPEAHQAEIVRQRDAYEQTWQDVLDEAVDAGLIRVNSVHLRRFCLGALNWTSVWYKRDGGMAVEEIADELLAVSIANAAAVEAG